MPRQVGVEVLGGGGWWVVGDGWCAVAVGGGGSLWVVVVVSGQWRGLLTQYNLAKHDTGESAVYPGASGDGDGGGGGACPDPEAEHPVAASIGGGRVGELAGMEYERASVRK